MNKYVNSTTVSVLIALVLLMIVVDSDDPQLVPGGHSVKKMDQPNEAGSEAEESNADSDSNILEKKLDFSKLQKEDAPEPTNKKKIKGDDGKGMMLKNGKRRQPRMKGPQMKGIKKKARSKRVANSELFNSVNLPIGIEINAITSQLKTDFEDFNEEIQDQVKINQQRMQNCLGEYGDDIKKIRSDFLEEIRLDIVFRVNDEGEMVEREWEDEPQFENEKKAFTNCLFMNFKKYSFKSLKRTELPVIEATIVVGPADGN